MYFHSCWLLLHPVFVIQIFLFQISDLHISMFTDPERYEQLKEFCKFNLKVINPKLVVASG